MSHIPRMPGPRSAGKPYARAVRGPRVGLLACVLCLGAANVAQGAEETPAIGHAHTPLVSSAALTWPELISATVQRFPQFVELAARENEADVLRRRAGSWLAGQPQVAMRYQTDRPWDNARLREYELGLELPLWRLGERRAAESLGAAASTESGAAAGALRHQVIGILRTVLWDIELAVNNLAVARDGARIAAELQSVVARQYAAGELPLSETLLMDSLVRQREATVIEAQAQLVDAERSYESLTGLTTKPAEFAEMLTQREDFDATHPEVVFADAQLQRARARLELTSRSAKGSPSVLIGPRRERAAFSDYSDDSLGLTVSVPIAGRRHTNVATSAAARLVAEAQASRAALLRSLDLDNHEARHTLVVVEESLALARTRAELARRSFEMSQEAFAQGEMPILELLRSEETNLLTQREVAALEVERQRAIARINQAVGVWP